MHCHNSENWPQRSGKKPTLNQRLTVPKTIKKDDTGQTTSDQFEDDFQLSVLFLHVVSLSLSLSLYLSLSHTHTTFCLKKLWPHWLSAQGLDLSTDVHPPPLVAGIWNKSNFSFHHSRLFIGFWAASSQTPHFGKATTVLHACVAFSFSDKELHKTLTCAKVKTFSSPERSHIIKSLHTLPSWFSKI